MKNKAKEKNNALVEHVVDSDMSNVLIDAFNRYAKEVITDRAIPDARDGLKPVQRRIIFDMYDQGYRSVKPTVKCATIVGHVMGHYHPHGDSSIYDALVHLSQSWKMEAPSKETTAASMMTLPLQIVTPKQNSLNSLTTSA